MFLCVALQSSGNFRTRSLTAHNHTAGLLDGDGFGGGLYIDVGCTEGCLVNGNNFTLNKVVEGAGGGFYSASPATMVVTNNRFTQNLAGADVSDYSGERSVECCPTLTY
jgi:hypothetical protein